MAAISWIDLLAQCPHPQPITWRAAFHCASLGAGWAASAPVRRSRPLWIEETAVSGNRRR